MKYATTVISAFAITGAIASPSLPWKHHYINSTQPGNTTIPSCNSTTPTNCTTQSNGTTPHQFVGFILPTVLKIHDISTNNNEETQKTVTVRKGAAETSTLYEIPVPNDVHGKTCGLVIRAGHLNGGDEIKGTKSIDIFNNTIESLADLNYGNRRNIHLARVDFYEHTGMYRFDHKFYPDGLKSFPCPAGTTVEWESVAVGDMDSNIIHQDFKVDGQQVPNGLSIGYY